MSFEIRTSERKTVRRCPQRWEWGYKQELKPKRESNPLWFGQAVHLALADWYKPGLERGPHPAETFRKVLEEGKVDRFVPDNPDDENEYVASMELGIDMLVRYEKEFGLDGDWEIIAPERTFSVWFPEPGNRSNKRWLRYVGTWDAVARYIGESNSYFTHGSIWLLEHKTAASITVQHLPTDDQAGAYWAVAPMILRREGLLKEGEVIEGILYNFLRKATDDPRPKNEEGLYCNKPTKQDYLSAIMNYDGDPGVSSAMKVEELAKIAKDLKLEVLGEPSKVQPAPYFLRIPVYRSIGERRTQLQRIRAEAQHIESYRSDRPLLPIIKNFTKDCAWDCDFYKMCKLHEAGEDWEEYRDAMYTTWEPYGAHQIKAA
ncbi:RecB-like exonuclease/helicase [Arthrobacter phage Wollypog]|uniref:RecB-like exonuclease/helicase n=1 Tax=Arthrobacter phage Wollypog TaxID=2790985 RepID=A0A7T3N1H5_9CAUD|nr:exonuclease [Arthrobacter phage Wollypog]QPX62598.1 RecB-like exonuclease/helicase [Arthrobacter phage Wollypog]